MFPAKAVTGSVAKRIKAKNDPVNLRTMTVFCKIVLHSIRFGAWMVLLERHRRALSGFLLLLDIQLFVSIAKAQ